MYIREERDFIANHFGIPEDQLEEAAREDGNESGSSIGMLTLKTLTVLYLVLTITAMYFLPVYYGQWDAYDEWYAFQLEFNLLGV